MLERRAGECERGHEALKPKPANTHISYRIHFNWHTHARIPRMLLTSGQRTTGRTEFLRHPRIARSLGPGIPRALYTYIV